VYPVPCTVFPTLGTLAHFSSL
jgi:predicted RNase H-like HicB family nuclease